MFRRNDITRPSKIIKKLESKIGEGVTEERKQTLNRRIEVAIKKAEEYMTFVSMTPAITVLN